MRPVLIVLTCTMGFAAEAVESVDARVEKEAPHLHCYSTAQSREQMSSRQLVDPFKCMRELAFHHQAEALGARLCHLGEALIYEISLLGRDGRIQKILVDATNGRPHSGRVDK